MHLQYLSIHFNICAFVGYGRESLSHSTVSRHQMTRESIFPNALYFSYSLKNSGRGGLVLICH